MSDTIVAVVRVEATVALGRLDSETSLSDRLRAAFEAVRNHWLAPSDEVKFQAAMEAVYLLASEEEKARMEAEARRGRALNALLSGVPVDIEAVAEADEGLEPVRAMRIYREVMEP